MSRVGFFQAVADEEENSGVLSTTLTHVPVVGSDVNESLSSRVSSIPGWLMKALHLSRGKTPQFLE